MHQGVQVVIVQSTEVVVFKVVFLQLFCWCVDFSVFLSRFGTGFIVQSGNNRSFEQNLKRWTEGADPKMLG